MSLFTTTDAVDIWKHATRPRHYLVLRSHEPHAVATVADSPDVQVTRTKGKSGAVNDDAVAGYRGCIDAVLAAYAAKTGKPMTVYGLAESIAAARNSTVSPGSVDRTLRLLNEGKTVLSEGRATSIAEDLGLDLWDLVFPVGKTVSDRHWVAFWARRQERLSAYPVPLSEVGGDPKGARSLADDLANPWVTKDVDDAFFVVARTPEDDRVNKALDRVRTIIGIIGSLQSAQPAPSTDCGRLAEALATLKELGVAVLAGRYVAVAHDADLNEDVTVRRLVLRFAVGEPPATVVVDRSDELNLCVADDERVAAAMERDLAWAGLNDIL